MYKVIIAFCITGLLCSCSEDPKESIVTSGTDSIKQNTISTGANDNLQPSAPPDTISPRSITAGEIPAGISYKGDLEDVYTWYDKNGRNYLLLSIRTRTSEIKAFMEIETTKELFADLYVVKPGTKPQRLWKLYDSRDRCIFSLSLDFLARPDVCDVDSNGINEVYIAYKTSCRSDAYPSDMKVIVHEGKQKFALRGLMIFRTNDFPDSLFTPDREIDLSKIPEEELKNTLMRDFGCFENANDFVNATPAILEHAKTYWRDNSSEN